MKCPSSRRAMLVMAIATVVSIVLLLLRTGISTQSIHTETPANSKSFFESPARQKENSFSSEGYIMSDHFLGQQGASMRGVLSLQCWAGSFLLPVRIVDPYIVDDLKMSELIDIEHFNAISQLARQPLIATWEEFSEKSPRDVIVVSTQGHRCESDHRLYMHELDVNNPTASTSPYSVGNNDTDCLSSEHLGIEVPSILGKFNYCIKRVVTKLSVGCCFRSPKEYREIMDIIYRGRDVRKFTVVFANWSPRTECQNPDNLHVNCSDPLKTKFKNMITPSKQLLDDAKYYTDHFLNSQNNIAVMIRPEQTILRLKSTSTDDKIKLITDCLLNTVDITHNIVQNSGRNSILLTLDIGRFGTQTTRIAQKKLEGRVDEVIKLEKHTFVSIYGDQWTFEDYEESFVIASNGSESPAYIAALQRILASQADCLILMGGGNFQLLALNDYLEKHPNPCVHFVCLDEYYETVTRLAMQPD